MSSSSILQTTTANKRQRGERSGAETTNTLSLREVVVANNGSNVIPVEKIGTMYMSSLQNQDSFSLSSVLCWPHCNDVEAVVGGGAGGGEGGGTRSPPSGIAIILQTECHALQTADKKTVTTVGW